jgi:hypothetical protein
VFPICCGCSCWFRRCKIPFFKVISFACILYSPRPSLSIKWQNNSSLWTHPPS